MPTYSRSQPAPTGFGSRSGLATVASGETESNVVEFGRQVYAVSIACADVSNIPADTTFTMKINRDGGSVMYAAMKGEDANDTNDIVYGLPAKAFDFILPDIAFIENIQFILSAAASGGPVLFEVTGIDEGIRVG
ncbi:MAG: hypothetical protein CL607_18055 [Anaerolineaceae bacterium]|nr:hypothetical protein [Anaerolineaceae bacterium]